MKIPENIKCPHCGEELGLNLTTRLMNESRVSFTMVPNPGELLAAKTVGDCISNLQDLFIASGDAMGVKTNVLVEGLNWNEGTVKVDLLLTRQVPGVCTKDDLPAPPSRVQAVGE